MNSNPNAATRRLDRRTAIKWMLTASAAMSASGWAQSATVTPPGPSGPSTPIVPLAARPGYGVDPNLLPTYAPGDFWPLTLDAAQRATVVALSDVILPADEHSPSASSVGVPDFIDEWISAPYPAHANDRRVVLEGVQWLERESSRRYQRRFVELTATEQNSICDDIGGSQVAADFATGAAFFATFRGLCMGGFYTTPEGMRDLRYVGNLPSESFAGPPAAVLQRLGLDGHVPA